MAIATAPRANGRGRQAAEVEAGRARDAEVLAQTIESREFAERVLAIGLFLSDPRPAHAVVGLGNELAYRAIRRIRQIGSVIL